MCHIRSCAERSKITLMRNNPNPSARCCAKGWEQPKLLRAKASQAYAAVCPGFVVLGAPIRTAGILRADADVLMRCDVLQGMCYKGPYSSCTMCTAVRYACIE